MLRDVPLGRRGQLPDRIEQRAVSRQAFCQHIREKLRMEWLRTTCDLPNSLEDVDTTVIWTHSQPLPVSGYSFFGHGLLLWLTIIVEYSTRTKQAPQQESVGHDKDSPPS